MNLRVIDFTWRGGALQGGIISLNQSVNYRRTPGIMISTIVRDHCVGGEG